MQSMDLDDTESEYHQLFEYVFVVGLKDKGKGALDTEVTYTFPPAVRPPTVCVCTFLVH